MKKISLYLIILFLFHSCSKWQEPKDTLNELPPIFPDYVDVTLPRNIAPMNFEIKDATHIQATLRAEEKEINVSGNRYVDISSNDWHELIEASLKGNHKINVEVSAWTETHPDGVSYKPFTLTVSADDIDQCIVYRLIPPGYELWSKMGIYQRDITSFEEDAIITNSQNNQGCVNCHSFANYDAQLGMMFHARGQGGGTVIYRKGEIEKIALEKLGPQKSGTYPMWHPSGNYIIFSSNITRQSFYAHSRDKIEVYDLKSDLILYDVRNNQVLSDARFTTDDDWETFPAFSPDGKWLYYCTAKHVKMPIEYDKLRYSICRVPFDSNTGRFGTKVDTVCSASAEKGSLSFPRLSPDGRYLLYTWAECATFPIHHKEADLRMKDLTTNTNIDINTLNSNDVDSYHSWSSNGKWIVLSSKRVDGRHTRLFLSHWDGKRFTKPMLIPQRDPQHNLQRMYSYNIPEFIKAPVKINPDDMSSLFQVEE